MIAKICAWGADREQARQRLVEALRETVLLGPQTNLSYLLSILEAEAFGRGEVHTGFIDEHLADWSAAAARPDAVESALWTAASLLLSRSPAAAGPSGHDGASAAAAPSVWQRVGPLRLVEEEA